MSASLELDDTVLDFSIAPYDGGEIPDYYDRLARLRAERGVAYVKFGPSPIHVLLRHADATEAMRDEVNFSKAEAFRLLTFPLMGPNLQGYDGHEHSVRRALVSPAFRRSVVPRYVEPLLRPIAEELLDELGPIGESDLMLDFAKKYPMRITNRLLGIPPADEQRMSKWAVLMLGFGPPDDCARAKVELTDYLLPLFDERRANPGEDLISGLVTDEIDGQRLDDEEILGFLRLLFPAGVDTTWLALGSLMAAVIPRPEIHERLLHDEVERGWAVEETIRWESSVGFEPRMTLEDVVVAGVEIPAHSMVGLCLPSANHDPAVFSDPEEWDLDRRPTQHIAFGIGRHFCLGAFLARAELQVALEVLLRKLPNIRLTEKPRIVGVNLRGPHHIRAEWDAVA